ncbi:histidine phosphatase family protein, partial [Chloroflexota bacterium]
SEAGYRQAESLRDRLADEKIDAIYSSDLKRALATAEVVSSGCEADIITCSELREVNYGDAEGLTFDEIRQLYPELAESISNFDLQLKFPGGESFGEFIERASKFADRLSKHAQPETILIVSHSGPLKVLLCHLMGIDMKHWRQIRLDNASLSIVETYPHRMIISLLNDTSHLRKDI